MIRIRAFADHWVNGTGPAPIAAVMRAATADQQIPDHNWPGRFPRLWPHGSAKGHVAAVAALVHADLGRDALLQLGHVTDDTDQLATLPQAIEDGHNLLQR